MEKSFTTFEQSDLRNNINLSKIPFKEGEIPAALGRIFELLHLDLYLNCIESYKRFTRRDGSFSNTITVKFVKYFDKMECLKALKEFKAHITWGKLKIKISELIHIYKFICIYK